MWLVACGGRLIKMDMFKNGETVWISGCIGYETSFLVLFLPFLFSLRAHYTLYSQSPVKLIMQFLIIVLLLKSCETPIGQSVNLRMFFLSIKLI